MHMVDMHVVDIQVVDTSGWYARGRHANGFACSIQHGCPVHLVTVRDVMCSEHASVQDVQVTMEGGGC